MPRTNSATRLGDHDFIGLRSGGGSCCRRALLPPLLLLLAVFVAVVATVVDTGGLAIEVGWVRNVADDARD